MYLYNDVTFECHLDILGTIVYDTKTHSRLLFAEPFFVLWCKSCCYSCGKQQWTWEKGLKSCCVELYLKTTKKDFSNIFQVNVCMTVSLNPFHDIVKCLIGGIFYPQYGQITGSPCKLSLQQETMSPEKSTVVPERFDMCEIILCSSQFVIGLLFFFETIDSLFGSLV